MWPWNCLSPFHQETDHNGRCLIKLIMCAWYCYHAIMIRTQLQLDPEQCERLEALAARQSNSSFAQLVREGVEHLLTAAPFS